MDGGVRGAYPAGLVGVPGTQSPVDVLRGLSAWPVIWLTCFDWTTLLGMAALTAPATVVLHPGFAGPGLHGVISALRSVAVCPVLLLVTSAGTDPGSVGADGLVDLRYGPVLPDGAPMAGAPDAVAVEPHRPAGPLIPLGPGYADQSVLRWSSLRLDRRRREAVWRDNPVPVTELQFRLLWALGQARGGVVGFAELSHALYGKRVGADRGRIQAHVLRLRRLIEVDGARPRVLLTVWGQGFRLAIDEPQAACRVS
jgi:DNA-binding winged helix-turn-helix (wHTH) protein